MNAERRGVMKNRKIVWFAIAVLALLFCGFGTGIVPGGMGLLPLRQIFAMFEVYGIYFPMAAVTGVYAPYGQNTAYLPIRAGTDWENPPAAVDFFIDGESSAFDTDVTFPFSGYRENIQNDGPGLRTISAVDTGMESVDIDLDFLPDSDGNGIPEVDGLNNPFAVPTPDPMYTDHTVYVGRVIDSDFFSAVASVIPPEVNTQELTYVMAGSPTGDFQDVLFEVDDRAVLPDEGRFIVRAAAAPGLINDDLGLLAVPYPPGTPFAVEHLAAFDAHLVADVGGVTMAVEDLDPYPMTVRVALPDIIPAGFVADVHNIGMPIFYANTSLDTDFNVVVDDTTFAQLPVPQVIENTAELVFEIDGLTAYVPMMHAGAPVLKPNALDPVEGPAAGGTDVTITAFGHLDDTGLTVQFGTRDATDVNVILNTVELSGPHLVTCVTPPGPAGPVDVFVTNPDPNGDGFDIFAMLEDAYLYLAGPAGPSKGRGGAGGPCFIATAAYGTPMADQLEVLRSFRDRYLLTNAAGTALMRAYYTYSPAVANVVANNVALRAITRAVLTALLTPLWVKIALASMAAGAIAIIRKKVTA